MIYVVISLYVLAWFGMYTILRDIYGDSNRLMQFSWSIFWPLILVLCGCAAIVQVAIDLYRTRKDWMV